jgi:hypothetical protein
MRLWVGKSFRTLFLLFYRPKGDNIGENVSIKNPAFKSALTKRFAFTAPIGRSQRFTEGTGR